MINNRQNGRRGRGRNGVRPQGGGGGTGRPEQGNRIDNRARGNAAQLLEKYKALARDAQMASDRVMTEYYLQFADHYFRVLADTRARLDEQRRPQGDQAPQGANSFQDDYDADDGEGDITDSFDDPRPDQQPRYQDRGQNGQQANGNQDRPQRQDRDRNDRPQYDRQQNGDGQQNGYAQDRGQRQDRPYRNRDGQNDGQRYDNQRQDGQRQDGPRQDGQRYDGQRQDTPRNDRGDRQDRPRFQRDDGQERGNEGQTYRTIRAEPSADRGPVPSPLAQAPVTPTPAPQIATQDNHEDAPRRTRTRRPAAEQPVAEAPPVIAPPPVALEAPVALAEDAPRPRRTRVARAAAPVETDGSDQIDRLAFLSTPAVPEPAADATPADDKPRRRRRPRAEIDAADTGDVAA